MSLLDHYRGGVTVVRVLIYALEYVTTCAYSPQYPRSTIGYSSLESLTSQSHFMLFTGLPNVEPH